MGQEYAPPAAAGGWRGGPAAAGLKWKTESRGDSCISAMLADIQAVMNVKA